MTVKNALGSGTLLKTSSVNLLRFVLLSLAATSVAQATNSEVGPLVVSTRQVMNEIQRDMCARASFDFLIARASENMKEGIVLPDPFVIAEITPLDGSLYAIKVERLPQFFIATKVKGSKCEALTLKVLAGEF